MTPISALMCRSMIGPMLLAGTLGWGSAVWAQAPSQSQAEPLRVDVIQMPNVDEAHRFQIVIQVRDERFNPAAGATVTFTMPATVVGGRLPDGSPLSVQTGADGRANSGLLNAQEISGPFDVEIEASFKDRTGRITVHVENIPGAVAPSKGRSKKMILLIAAGGGAGAYLATRGGTVESKTPTVTLGFPAIGGP